MRSLEEPRGAFSVLRAHVPQTTMRRKSRAPPPGAPREPRGVKAKFRGASLASNAPSVTSHPLIGFTTLPHPAVEHGMVCRTTCRRRELQCCGSAADLARPGKQFLPISQCISLNLSHITAHQQFARIQQTVDNQYFIGRVSRNWSCSRVRRCGVANTSEEPQLMTPGLRTITAFEVRPQQKSTKPTREETKACFHSRNSTGLRWFLSDLQIASCCTESNATHTSASHSLLFRDMSLYVIRWSVVRNVFPESCPVGTLVPIKHGVKPVV